MIYNDLALFTAVAQHLSFSGAAEQLGIPLSRVSRRIADLETHLGVKLFERTTRQVRLTEEGRRLLDRCQGPFEALQDISGLTGDTKTHVIRLTAPPLAARTTIGPRLFDFAQAHPDLRLELTTTNSMLDFFRDNIDLAFRLGPLSDSSLIAKRLWAVPYCFCAGRGLIDAEDLHQPISVTRLLSLPALLSGQAWRTQGGEPLKPTKIAHYFDSLELVAEAARRNLGVAMLPRDLLGEGLLELQVRDMLPLRRDMYVVYPSRRLLPARVRALIDFMISGGS